MPTKNDTTGERITFQFNGDAYKIPPSDEWDIDVLEAIDDQRLTHALRALLGDDQYATFRAKNKTVKSLGDFMKRAGEKVGAGNS